MRPLAGFRGFPCWSVFGGDSTAQSGLETMEHLSVELLAGPLRLIADKNEKSRGELTRFLTKAVSTGEGRRARAGELGCPEKGPLFFGVSSSPLPGRCSDRDGERALSERKRVVFFFFFCEAAPVCPRHVHCLRLPFLSPPLVCLQHIFLSDLSLLFGTLTGIGSISPGRKSQCSTETNKSGLSIKGVCIDFGVAS